MTILWGHLKVSFFLSPLRIGSWVTDRQPSFLRGRGEERRSKNAAASTKFVMSLLLPRCCCCCCFCSTRSPWQAELLGLSLSFDSTKCVYSDGTYIREGRGGTSQGSRGVRLLEMGNGIYSDARDDDDDDNDYSTPTPAGPFNKHSSLFSSLLSSFLLFFSLFNQFILLPFLRLLLL